MTRLSRREKFLLWALLIVSIGSAPVLADDLVAFRAGPGPQITCGTAAPSHISTRGVDWCRSDDKNAPWNTTSHGDFKYVLVSPSPAPGDDGKVVTLDSTTPAGFTFATASGGSLPTQTSNANKFLTTNGAAASWSLSVAGTPFSFTGTTAVGTFTWTACTLTNSWVNYGGTQATCAYGKDAAGQVHLKGSIKSGTCGAAAFTLPAGYRGHSGEVQDFPPAYNSGTTFVDITHNTGVVIAGCGANTLFTLDGVTFPAEQ